MEAKTNTELIAIIASGTEDEKEEVWKRLFGQVAHFQKRCLNACMCSVAATADEAYRQKAWEVLLQNDPLPIDFAHVVARSISSTDVQKNAWERLLKAELEDSYCLLYVIDYAVEPYRSMALDAFITRGYCRKDLETLLHGRHGMETEFWKQKIAHLL